MIPDTGLVQCNQFSLGGQAPIVETAALVSLAIGFGVRPINFLAIVMGSPHQAGFGVGHNSVGPGKPDCQGEFYGLFVTSCLNFFSFVCLP